MIRLLVAAVAALMLAQAPGVAHVSVTATGPLVSFRGHGSYKLPSEFNGHQNYRGKERAASGTVSAGSIDATFSSAGMSVFTWSM